MDHLEQLIRDTFQVHATQAPSTQGLRAAASTGHRRLIGRWLAPALVAATVVGISVGVVLVSHRSATSPPVDPNPSASAVPAPNPNDPNYTKTIKSLDTMLAEVPRLPGTINAARPPVPALAGSPSIQTTGGDLVNRIQWATAPSSFATATAFFKSRPSGGIGTYPDHMEFYYDGTAASAYQQPTLNLTVVPDGTGVALRLVAVATFNPSRPAGEYVNSVTSIDVTVLRPGQAPTVRRTLSGAAATELAKLFDALPTGVSNGFHECGMIRYQNFSDELVFHTDAGNITAQDHVLNLCSDVTVSVNGVASMPLVGVLGNDDLGAGILKALGLPAGYGY
jgi:hypothetical protein